MLMSLTFNTDTARFTRNQPATLPETVQLNRRKLYLVHVKSHPVEILCLRGQVYITQERDAKDYLLTSGQRLIASRPGIVIIEAYENSQVSIMQALEK